MSKHLQNKTQIKICGITNFTDANDCVNLGANYLGLIFVPNTKRHLTFEKIKELSLAIKSLKNQNFKLVLVTKLQYLAELTTLLELFDIIQIHDNYNADSVAELKITNPKLQIWQLFDFNFPKISDVNISSFIIDKPKNNQMTQLEYIELLDKTEFPDNFVLAGEISVENLDQFLKFKPTILDICSSVESSFGKKSKSKLTKLFQTINSLKN
jgi:phosphoribosylanthranilate isomerase